MVRRTCQPAPRSPVCARRRGLVAVQSGQAGLRSGHRLTVLAAAVRQPGGRRIRPCVPPGSGCAWPCVCRRLSRQGHSWLGSPRARRGPQPECLQPPECRGCKARTFEPRLRLKRIGWPCPCRRDWRDQARPWPRHAAIVRGQSRGSARPRVPSRLRPHSESPVSLPVGWRRGCGTAARVVPARRAPSASVGYRT